MYFLLNWQRPTFPGSFPPSIISANELNYCVRDGNRCDLIAIITRSSLVNFSYYFVANFFQPQSCMLIHSFAFSRCASLYKKRDLFYSLFLCNTMSYFLSSSVKYTSTCLRLQSIFLVLLKTNFVIKSIVPSKLNNVKSFSLKPWSSVRPISIGQLNTLLHLHLRPINVIVSHGSYHLMEEIFSCGGLRT